MSVELKGRFQRAIEALPEAQREVYLMLAAKRFDL